MSPWVAMASDGIDRLGPYTIDWRRRLVICEGRSTELGWRAAQALRLLADAGGEVVSREALFHQLWPGVTVDESSLNKCISQVRKALSNGDGPDLVETVPRVGYRLAVPVVGTAAPAVAPAARSRLLRVALGLAAVLLTVGCGWAWAVWTGRQARGREAEEALRKGRELLQQRDPASVAAAVRFFQRAATLRPDQADAYSSLAQAIHRLGDNSAERSRMAIDAAQRGVALDDRCARCQATLGFMLFYRGWAFADGERHLRRALELAPGDHEVNANLAMLLAAQGRQHEALAAIDSALAVNPFRASRHAIRASVLYFSGRYQEAIAASERASSLESCAAGADWRSKSLAMLGLREQAVRAIAGCYFPEQRVPGEAGPGFHRLLDLTQSDPESRRKFSIRRAAWKSLLGDSEGALAELESAHEARHFSLIWIAVDPVFTGLRDNARYRALLDNMGLTPPRGQAMARPTDTPTSPSPSHPTAPPFAASTR
ncbi:MAG TPA: hypothetical protein DEH78_04355 [Solibacterales bacterium]|nr:hypothetical protein [Bryobacterales bacterium]